LLAIGLIFPQFVYDIKYKLTPAQTVYCHFENNNITDSSLPRAECVNLKIVTKDINKINLTAFNTIDSNYSCSKKVAGDCLGENFYLSSYGLDNFCKNCTIEGYLCAAYYITYKTNSSFKNLYEKMYFFKNFSSKEELDKAFLDCSGLLEVGYNATG